MPENEIALNPTLNLKPKFKPKTSTEKMVDNALKELNNRNGSSLVAVKKYIAANYNIDIESASTSNRIKLYLKKGLENGSIVKTSGTGLTGCFKIKTKVKNKDEKSKIKVKPPEAKIKPKLNPEQVNGKMKP